VSPITHPRRVTPNQLWYYDALAGALPRSTSASRSHSERRVSATCSRLGLERGTDAAFLPARVRKRERRQVLAGQEGRDVGRRKV